MTMKYLSCFILAFVLCACVTQQKAKPVSTEKTHALRLLPGQDLLDGIQRYVNEHHMEAGWLVTCAGSLTQYNIRFANAPSGSRDSGHFEIVSLGGTLSQNGSHIHISISDSTGKTIGGHLLQGCTIYTTAEIVLQESSRYTFTREQDGTTPWAELQVREKKD